MRGNKKTNRERDILFIFIVRNLKKNAKASDIVIVRNRKQICNSKTKNQFYLPQ